MALPGRKPTPAHLKLVTGNPGRRPIADVTKKAHKPRVSEGAPRMPKGIRPEVKKIWQRAIRSVPHSLLVGIDAEILYQWCLARCLLETAEEKFFASGMLVKTPNGMPVQSPYLAVINRQQQILLALAGELGFTPIARQRLGVDNGAPLADDDEG